MAAALALFAAGSVISAYSSYKQAEAQNLQTEYQIQAAEFNAEINRLEADYARKKSLKDARQHRKNLNQFIGTQRARMGGSGFSLDSASYVGLIDSSIELGEADALAIRYEGELTAWRKETEAQFLDYQADVLESSKVDPAMAGFTSLLGSGAKGATIFGRS